MRSEATADDWSWFSATGRAYRAREATAAEWYGIDAESFGGRRELIAVVRRRDGAAVLVPCDRINEMLKRTDDQLQCFEGVLNAMTVILPIASYGSASR